MRTVPKAGGLPMKILIADAFDESLPGRLAERGEAAGKRLVDRIGDQDLHGQSSCFRDGSHRPGRRDPSPHKLSAARTGGYDAPVSGGPLRATVSVSPQGGESHGGVREAESI